MSAKIEIKNNCIISSFFGQSPYSVQIEPSDALTPLLEQARETQELSFEEKLPLIEKLAVSAMKNAYEGMFTTEMERREKCREMVMQPHSLRDALKEELGCCRYQATLFFLLAAEAKLGSKHYLQSAPIRGINTCYNELHDESGKVYYVSIFTKSLSDQKYNYSSDPTLFERPNTLLHGEQFLAYTIDKEGEVTLYCRRGCHFDAEEKPRAEMERFQKILDTLLVQIQSMPEDDANYKITVSNI
ncbi:MAG: hypothetical protein V4492_04290, partial [Chlamydiota bacterium]